jgi:hypothetical protein
MDRALSVFFRPSCTPPVFFTPRSHQQTLRNNRKGTKTIPCHLPLLRPRATPPPSAKRWRVGRTAAPQPPFSSRNPGSSSSPLSFHISSTIASSHRPPDPAITASPSEVRVFHRTSWGHGGLDFGSGVRDLGMEAQIRPPRLIFLIFVPPRSGKKQPLPAVRIDAQAPLESTPPAAGLVLLPHELAYVEFDFSQQGMFPVLCHICTYKLHF